MAPLKEGLNYQIRSVLSVIILTTVVLEEVDADAVSWNYKAGNNGGPERWYLVAPDCGGVMQSPININTSRVLYDPNLELLDFTDYGTMEEVELELENVGGHTAEVHFSGKRIYLKGGSLPDKYKLEQFHFHWGQNNRRGSEHGLNGQHYPMEVHFVHSQYGLGNSTDPATHPFGLAVVAFFFKIGKKNYKYEQLLEHFDKIAKPHQKVQIPTFRVQDFLPLSNRFDYFRYQGSLTTPPCHETVIWSVATELIEISEPQMDKFRGLFDEYSLQLVDDFRPIQRINQRTILTTSLLYRETKGSDSGSFISPQTTTFILTFIYLLILIF